MFSRLTSSLKNITKPPRFRKLPCILDILSLKSFVSHLIREFFVMVVNAHKLLIESLLNGVSLPKGLNTF